MSSEGPMHASGELCMIFGGRGVHARAGRLKGRSLCMTWWDGDRQRKGGQESSFVGERLGSRLCTVGWLLLLGLCVFSSWFTRFVGLGSWAKFCGLLLSLDRGPKIDQMGLNLGFKFGQNLVLRPSRMIIIRRQTTTQIK